MTKIKGSVFMSPRTIFKFRSHIKNNAFLFMKMIILIMVFFIFSTSNVFSNTTNNDARLDDILINGYSINLIDNKYEYDIPVDGDFEGIMEFSFLRKHEEQIVVGGNESIILDRANKSHTIISISADKRNVQAYEINFIRENTSKLKNLYVEGFDFINGTTFNPNTKEYYVNIFRDAKIKVKYETFNDNSVVSISDIKNNQIKVNVVTANSDNQEYIININEQSTIDFIFNENRQVFIVPENGYYKLELWGAQGSNNESFFGGLGDYVAGIIRLEKNEILYLYTGGDGSSGINGGGSSTLNAFGGGATDIRINGESLNDRIIVAGGGGAASETNNGGYGGNPGQNGFGSNAGIGATQIKAGNNATFGFGESSTNYHGGGGGFFGGGASQNINGSGGGGSSYIFTDDSPKPTDYKPDNKYQMSDTTYGSVQQKNEGNGYIRITSYFDDHLDSNELLSIKIDGEEIIDFNPNTLEYTVDIEGELQKTVEFEIEKKHIHQEVIGDLSAELKYGDYTHRFNVTSADGSSTQTYSINFKRKTTLKLADIMIDGESISNFHYDNTLYNIILNSAESKLEAIAFDSEAKVLINKNSPFEVGANTITITVSKYGMSEQMIYRINGDLTVSHVFDAKYGDITGYYTIPVKGYYTLTAYGAGGSGTANGSTVKAEFLFEAGEKIYYSNGGLPNGRSGGRNGGGTGGVSPKDSSTYGKGGAGYTLLGPSTSIAEAYVVAGGGGGAHGQSATSGSSTISSTPCKSGYSPFNSYPGTGSTNGNGGNGGGTTSGGSVYSRGAWGGGGGGGGYPGGGGGCFGAYVNYTYYGPGGGLSGGNKIHPNGTQLSVNRNYSGEGKVEIALDRTVAPVYDTLKSIKVFSNEKEIELLQDFRADRLEYDLILEPEDFNIKLIATAEDENALVLDSIGSGNTEYVINSGEIQKKDIIVEATDGKIKKYTINILRKPSSYKYLNDLTFNGSRIAGFNPEILEYTIDLSYDTKKRATIGWEIARPDQEIIGKKDQLVDLVHNQAIVIRVWAEDKINYSDYKIIPNFEDSNLLKELNIIEVGNKDFDFNSEIFEYNFNIPLSVAYLNMEALAFDDDAEVIISGGGYLKPGLNKINITIKHPRLDSQVYTLNVTRSESDADEGVEYEYIYTGAVEYFEVPYTGEYKIEAWGAQGGNRGSSEGGRGGYSQGTIYLYQGDVLAVYVGGAGNNSARGFNGGGLSGTSGVYGGGASDIRVYENGYSLYDRILVAGGGGSVGAINKAGSAGGGLVGVSNTSNYGSGGQGATQSSAGLRGGFGFGGSGLASNYGRGGAGGGGFYGGGGVNPDGSGDDDRGGGGGSAYIYTAKSYRPANFDIDTKYYFYDEESIAGNNTMPNKVGGYTTGNIGNGFVRITGLKRDSNDNFLKRIDLDPDVLVLAPEFDFENNVDQQNFDLYLDSETAEIKINGVPVDSRATITGNGDKLVEAGTSIYELIVSAVNGLERSYTITTHRPKSSNSFPTDIKITGLAPSLCDTSDDYCVLDNFDVTQDGKEYTMIVPGRIEEIEFTTVKSHPFQTSEGDGVIKLEANKDNEVEIVVYSEDKNNSTTYKFIIVRDMTSNTDLSHLKFVDPEVRLDFHKDITEYYVSIPYEYEKVSDLDLDFAPFDPAANAQIVSEFDLELGLNEIEIRVVSANSRVSKSYRIFAYREQSANALIKELKIFPNDGDSEVSLSPTFNKFIDKYFLTVDNIVDKIRIEALVDEEHTIFDLTEGGIYPLEVGSNNIVITTLAMDKETEKTYEITIVRRPSTNNNIEEIMFDNKVVADFNDMTVNGSSPFRRALMNINSSSSDFVDKTVIIDSSYTKPRIVAKLQHDKAKYTMTGAINGFVAGDNVIYFKVVAESGSTKTYAVNFYRPASENTELRSVSNNLFKLDFDKKIRNYDIAIPYTETALDIAALVEHNTSTLKGNGKYVLVPGNNEIKLEVTAESGDVDYYTFNITMMKNNNPNLKSLSIDKGELMPAFNPNIFEYTVDMPDGLGSININAVASVASTEILGNGRHLLEIGENEILLKTRADGGKEAVYKIKVNRDKSVDTTLSNLIVKEGSLSPTFKSNIYNYTVLVPNGTRRVEVIPSTNHEKAKVMVLGSDNLILGENLVYVRVMAEDTAKTKDYILKVIVQDPPSENTDLETLSVNKGTLNPNFSPNIRYYNIDVANEIDSISVNAKAKEGIITSGLGEHNLKVGKNLITISIKAENGIINDYQLEINRLLSTNTNLEVLDISNIEKPINFKPLTYSYNVETFDSFLKINAKTEHSNATYQILNNNDLITGENTDVIVRVTSEDKNHTQDYVLSTHKLKSINNNLKSLVVEGYNLEPIFSKDRTTYKLNVRHEINQIKLSAVAEDIYASLNYDLIVDLEIGRNFVDIVVTSESGKNKTYTIEVIRDGSYIRDLDGISVNNEPILNFEKVLTEYSLEYDYELESVYIDYIKSDDKSTVVGGGEKTLKVGINKFNLIVTSENGDTKTYILNITRKAINSAKLKNLEVSNHLIEPMFDSDLNIYTFTVHNEIEKLDLKYETLDPNAEVVITGNQHLQVGNNVVKITVKSSSRDIEEVYTLNVIKYQYSNNTLLDLSSSIGTLTPKFEKYNHVYNIEVEPSVEKITLLGLKELGTTVTGLDEEYTLKMGINHFTVSVESNSGGAVRVYNIFVNRSYSNANDLLSLRVRANNQEMSLDKVFDPNILEYSLAEEILVGTEFVTVTTTTNGKSVIGDGRVNIVAGDNTLIIKVISESGIEKEYTLNLHRTKSDNNYLTNITPSSGSLNPYFIYSASEYELRLDSSVNTLSFNVSIEDQNASVSGHQRMIVEPGRSERIIKVLSESGLLKVYKIVVIKEDTNNALLKELDIVKYGLGRTFDPTIFEYDIKLPFNKLTLTPEDIIAIADDANSKIYKGSTISLNTITPSIYEIEVRAIDGFSRETYRLNVIREMGNDARIKEIEFGEYGRLNKIFKSDIYNYELEFTHEVSHFDKQLISKLVLNDANATVTYSNNDKFEIFEDMYQRFSITIESEDKSDTKTYFFDISSRKSTDSKLSSLKVEGGKLSPTFNPNVLEYTVSVDENLTSIPIIATTRDKKAKIISDLENVEISKPSTTIDIVVESEKGDQTIYKLTVNRNLTHSTSISKLEITNANNAKLNPEYDDFFDEYRAEVERVVSNIGIIATLGHPSQSVELFDEYNNPLNMNSLDLAIGENNFRLQVNSAFEEKRNIKLAITRKGETNNYLESLEVLSPKNEATELNFEPNKFEYFIEVNNLVESLELKYLPQKDSSKVVVIGNDNFKVGLNDVVVKVTNEMGNTLEYIIHVLKGAKFNNDLANITVSDGNIVLSNKENMSPNFSKFYTDYTVTVENVVNNVTIEGVAELPLENTIFADSENVEIIQEIEGQGVEVNLRVGNNIVYLRVKHNDTEEIKTYTVNVFRKKFDGIELTDLQVFKGKEKLTLNPDKFDPKLNNYTLNVEPDTTELTVTPILMNENANAKIEITGNKNLVDGENVIRVRITSEDRTKMKIYTIVVNKSKSSINTLDKLSAQAENKTPFNFDLSKEELKYEVESQVDSVSLSAVASDKLATVTNVGTHSINYGENIIDISVTAQNGDVRIYKVNIFRMYDNNLKSLSSSVGTLAPIFNKNIYKYTIEVSENVNEIGLFAEANNLDASLDGVGFKDLEMGENKFIVKVSSSDGSYKETEVTVVRLPSDNAYLKVLNIQEGSLSPSFSKSENEYITYIKNTHNSINLDVLLDHNSASYEVSVKGNDGQIEIIDADENKVTETIIITDFIKDTIEVNIKVTSAANTTNDYKLIIYRQQPAIFSNLLSDLVVKSNTPSVNVLQMNPEFSSNENSYILPVTKDVTSINISGKRESNDAEILGGFGDFPVNPGVNFYNVTVRSKDGIENNYQIFIFQQDSSDASLELIEFKEGKLTPVFESIKQEYTLNVNSNVKYLDKSSAVIKPTIAGTTWEISGHQNLEYGNNEVLITTRSADKTTTLTYKINVYRDDNYSLYLKDLNSNVGKLKEEFKKDHFGPYTIEVSGKTNSIILNGIPEEADGIKSISNINKIINLAGVDSKRVEINVLGKNNKSITYVVDIVKNYDQDAYLTHLWVNPGILIPEFKEDIFDYVVEVESDVERIEIKATTDIDAEINGLGTKSLSIGENDFVITITTNGGTVVNTYKIKVIRKAILSSKILELEFEEVNLIGFDKDIFEYDLVVPNEIENLNIRKIVLEDPENSTYQILSDPNKFEVGRNNKLEITVSNTKTKETSIYVFNVEKQVKAPNVLTSIKVTNESKTIEYNLVPKFESNIISYDVEVPHHVDKVRITAQTDDGSSSVGGGNGGVTNLEIGENTHIVSVIANGLKREYILRIFRGYDTNNYLKELNIIGANLSKEFNRNDFDYVINVDSNIKEIELEGVAESDYAEVIGNGKVDINKKETQHNIIVVAQNGESRTYKIKIIKEVSEDSGVINIKPTNENVSLDFKSDTYSYEIVVSDDIYELGFDVLTKDENALVSGNKVKDLDIGENTFEIKITSQSGNNVITYKIVVLREKTVKSIKVEPSNIELDVGDSFNDLKVTFDPIDTNDKKVSWSSTDESIVLVDENGLLTGVSEGSAEIIVTLDSNPEISTKIVVEVISLVIESEILEIDRDKILTDELFKEGNYKISGYVIGSNQGTQVIKYKEMFKNKLSTLKIYDSENQEIVDNTKLVGTHMTLRLEINGIIHDELMVFVRGDGNGDGNINLLDLLQVQNKILNVPSLKDENYFDEILYRIYFDINNDNNVNLLDLIFIQNHILNPNDYDLNGKEANNE